MSKLFRAIAFLCILSAMSCVNNESPQPGYIGRNNIIIKDSIMSPEVLLAFGRLSDPCLSPDSSLILYGVSYQSIEENRSCRNLFITNLDGSKTIQISKDGKSISNARWSKDGKRIYFIQAGQIYSADLLGNDFSNYRLGEKTLLSDVTNGVIEFKLSPDFSKLIYSSTIKGNVKTPKDFDKKLDKAEAYVADNLMYRHWDHWTTELPHSYVADWNEAELSNENKLGNTISLDNSVDILGGDEVKFELPIEPFSGLEQLAWSPDSKYIAYSCKKLMGKEYAFSTNTEIFIYNVDTKESKQITKGGGYDTDPIWSPDGKHLAWLSMARDGYEADKTNLMIADLDGEKASNIRNLTYNFKYNASSPLWEKGSKAIYFNALTEGLQAIYRAELKGIDAIPYSRDEENEGYIDNEYANIVRKTSPSLIYDFNSPFAILNDNTLLTSYCSMDFPNELVAVKDYDKIEQISHENKHILSQLQNHKTEAKYIKTVDGKDMLTWILYPPKFDPSKKYPAIEICLGGPQGTLSQSWSYRWNYRLMCEQGYVVVLPNRRGTTAFGQEWTEQISGDYIGLNMQDYLQAARYIKSQPYISKLAATGASYGGFSVYYLAGIHNNTYDCFIAHAGIFDEKYMYYETEEMWFPNWDNGGLTEYKYKAGQQGSQGDGITFGGMQQAGSPWSSKPKAIRHYKNSPAENVSKWNTPILCIHGGKDYRIPYDQGMAAFNTAQMMGVPSKLIIFPNENHWILQAQNALFWHRSYFDWLDQWCK